MFGKHVRKTSKTLSSDKHGNTISTVTGLPWQASLSQRDLLLGLKKNGVHFSQLIPSVLS